MKSRSVITVMMTLCLLMIAVPGVYGDTPPQQDLENSSYLLRVFEGKYLEIKDRVSQGDLSADVLEKAKKIRADLKKFIIKRNAELEILKVDILDGSKEDSKAALNQMGVLAADTEQNKMHYLQKLTLLAPTGSQENAYSVVPLQEIPAADYFEAGPKKHASASSKRVKAKAKVKKPSIWETKDINLRMQLAPEDLTQEEFE